MSRPDSLASVPVAILAGGLATRLGPLAAARPKSLVEVAGRPFVDHQLELLRARGLRRVVLCLGHLGEQVEAHVGGGARYGLQVGYVHDGERLLGTGGALRAAAPCLGPLFFTLYGDSYTDLDFAAVLAAWDGRAAGVLTVLHNRGRWDRSNVAFDQARGRLRYDKRHPSPDMEHVDYGVALLTGAALAALPEGPSDLGDLYTGLSAAGRLAGFEVATRFYEIGSPQGLEETRALLARRAALA